MKRVVPSLVLGAITALVTTGCPTNGDAAKTTAELDGSTSSSGARGVNDAALDAEADDEVKPVYDTSPNAPTDPTAKKLCAALSDIPEKNRATCCHKAPMLVVAAECERMLSAAVISKASTLADADVNACVAALEKTYAGCDWVGPFPPPPPSECTAIIQGTHAAGERCRSSFECAAGLACHGLTPTHAGKCGAPKPDGDPCGGTVDALGTVARQLPIHHPECEHVCIAHRCNARSPEGAACMTTPECADGLQCIQKKCVKGTPARLGQACPGAVCEAPAECILGTCAVKKPSGEACTQDFECKGGCNRTDGGAKGICGARCDIR